MIYLIPFWHFKLLIHNIFDCTYREHYVGWDAPENALDATRYRQMAGRAGRAGIDTHGEAIIIAPRKPGVARQLADLMDVRLHSPADSHVPQALLVMSEVSLNWECPCIPLVRRHHLLGSFTLLCSDAK